MELLWDVSVAFPSIVWTVLVGVASAYWLLAMVGVLGTDVLDGGTEAVAEAGAEALAEAGTEALAEAGTEAGPTASVDAAADGLSALTLLGSFRRRKAPMTVKLSLYFVLGWFVTVMTSYYAGDLLSAILPARVWGAALLGLTALLCLPLTALFTLPFDPAFKTHNGPHNRDFIGRVAEVRTGRVDSNFGQALVSDGGAGLLVEVRCSGSAQLTRGQRALLLDYDAGSGVYEVEAYDAILKGQ